MQIPWTLDFEPTNFYFYGEVNKKYASGKVLLLLHAG
jgi:hypothetical protein